MSASKQIDLNLTNELAQLITFTADVATAIRMYSAYNGSAEYGEDAALDLMWLSDCLHRLDTLAHAILKNRQDGIVSVCDTLIKAYEDYQVINPCYTRHAKACFERNQGIFSLQQGIDIFKGIRAKVVA